MTKRLLSLLVMITLVLIASVGNGNVDVALWSAGGRFLEGGDEAMTRNNIDRNHLIEYGHEDLNGNGLNDCYFVSWTVKLLFGQVKRSDSPAPIHIKPSFRTSQKYG